MKDEPVLVTHKDVKRVVRKLSVFLILLFIILAATIITGMFVPAVSKAAACNNDTVNGTLTQVLLNNTSACIDESLWRLGFALAGVVLALGLAIVCSGEKSFEGLRKAIFSPDGNESPVLLVGIYTFFILATMATTPFTAIPNFILGLSFRLARNIILGVVLSFVVIRFTGITSVEAYLRENKTPMSNGLPILQAIALIIAFFVGKALLGG